MKWKKDCWPQVYQNMQQQVFLNMLPRLFKCISFSIFGSTSKLMFAGRLTVTSTRANKGVALVKNLGKNIVYFQARGHEEGLDVEADVITRISWAESEAELTGILQPVLEKLLKGTKTHILPYAFSLHLIKMLLFVT